MKFRGGLPGRRSASSDQAMEGGELRGNNDRGGAIRAVLVLVMLAALLAIPGGPASAAGSQCEAGTDLPTHGDGRFFVADATGTNSARGANADVTFALADVCADGPWSWSW